MERNRAQVSLHPAQFAFLVLAFIGLATVSLVILRLSSMATEQIQWLEISLAAVSFVVGTAFGWTIRGENE